MSEDDLTVSRREFDELRLFVESRIAALDGVVVPDSELAIAQSQAEQYRRSIDSLLSGWKEMLVRPLPIDCYAIAMNLVFTQILHDVAQSNECRNCGVTLSAETVRFIEVISDSTTAQSAAIKGFVRWASSRLVEAVNGKNEDASIVFGNLRSAELVDLLDSVWRPNAKE